jgi:hypothetical protein
MPLIDISEAARKLIAMAKARPDYHGGRLAFVASLNPKWQHGVGLGVAEENQPGYMPLDPAPDTKIGPGPANYREALELADRLNIAIGLEVREAYLIVVSSMVGTLKKGKSK